MQSILSNMANGSGTSSVAISIKILFELAMFNAMGTFIVVSLPAIAAALGGGLSVSPGQSILNAITNMATNGAARAMPKPKTT